MNRLILTLLSCLVLLTGCSSTKYAYREIAKDNDAYTTRTYKTTQTDLYNAMMQVLLSKKFIIDHEDKVNGSLNASRYFTKSYQTVVVVVQVKIISKNDNEQQLFLNAVQTTERNYVSDKTRFFLFVIPLPGGGGKEVTKSKESEIIISERSFYDNLFKDIDKVISQPK